MLHRDFRRISAGVTLRFGSASLMRDRNTVRGAPEAEMLYSNVKMSGIAHIEAPLRLLSSEIEARLAPALARFGVSPGLLKKLSGIESRRMFDPAYPPSEGAAEAAVRAIESAGIDRAELGVLVNTSVCRDATEPPTASMVHHKLGLSEHCVSFDVGNACLGFINGMEMVAAMIDRGQTDHGIVVNCENTHFAVLETIKRLLDPRTTWTTFRDNFATLTLGSGAVAMVLSRATSAAGEHRFLGGVTLAATQHCRLCTAQVDRMITDTKKLFHHGLELGLKTWQVARQVLGWTIQDIDHFVIHQVGKAHTEQFARTLGIDLTKIFRLYPDHGNIGPAGVPIALSKMVEGDRLRPGDRVALMGIGSGINCSMAELAW
jgi:3-oxoacyl-[acyl-carrier-protein] synthase-3